MKRKLSSASNKDLYEDESINYFVARNMLNGKYILISVPCEYIQDCTVGHKNIYFIN